MAQAEPCARVPRCALLFLPSLTVHSMGKGLGDTPNTHKTLFLSGTDARTHTTSFNQHNSAHNRDAAVETNFDEQMPVMQPLNGTEPTAGGRGWCCLTKMPNRKVRRQCHHCPTNGNVEGACSSLRLAGGVGVCVKLP